METNLKVIDSSVTGITENFKNALVSIETKIKTNNYVLKINGSEVVSSELLNVQIDLSHLTHSGRKKVAKRIYNYNKKGSLKTMNFLFYVLHKMKVTKDAATVRISHKESEIQVARSQYIKLRNEAEIARVKYKTLKGNFYK